MHEPTGPLSWRARHGRGGIESFRRPEWLSKEVRERFYSSEVRLKSNLHHKCMLFRWAARAVKRLQTDFRVEMPELAVLGVRARRCKWFDRLKTRRLGKGRGCLP